jgi:zinc protease
MPTNPVTKEVLPNGLTVIVAENHSAPVVAINLWVRAGYFDEEDSEVGISHVIEHMFFKGTALRPSPDQIANEIKALGGELNAGTYYDFTNYHVILPKENFRQGLEIQADALMHPRFDPEELKRELEAVLQEARRKIDSPGAYAVEMLYREAFDAHRIRRWRIGTEEGLRAMTRDDLMRYYRAHYLPDRVILSVVGDLETAAAIEAAHVFLMGMPDGAGAPLGSPAEPPQERFRYRRLTGDIKRAQTILGFHAAPALSDDDNALRILAYVLGAGRSSRLFQAVKERDGLVDAIGSSVESFRDIGVFCVMAENDPGHTPRVVEAIQSEIELLRREPPKAAEIERARTAIEFRHQQNRSEALGQSSILAYYEAMGGYHLAEEVVAKLSRVSAEDVCRVAEGYLNLANATLLEYLPESATVPQPETPALAETLRRTAAARPIAEPAPARAAATASRPSDPVRIAAMESVGAVRRLRFESGPVLLYEERRDLPLVTFCVAFRGGRSSEGREECGTTRLLQAVMTKGSPTRDARRVATEIDSLGTAIERMIDEDYFGFSMTLLSRCARRGAEILMDLVRRPALRQEEIEKERTLLLAAQASIKDQSLPHTFQLFRQAAFGSHPYALPTYGLQASVQAMRRDSLVRWHRQTVRPASMIISTVGDISEQEALDLWGASMADWTQEGHGGKDPGQLVGWGASEVVEIRRKQQTAQVIGFPTPGLLSPDRFSLDVVQAITSGLGGRFFEAVRGKRGLAYAVHAFNYNRVNGGAFAIYLGTSPADEAEARRVLFQEIARLRQEGPRHDEVERAIRYLRGQHAVALQGNGARAVRYIDAEVRGLGVEAVQKYPERIAAVGQQDVQDALWRYLDPDHCAMGILRGETAAP